MPVHKLLISLGLVVLAVSFVGPSVFAQGPPPPPGPPPVQGVTVIDPTGGNSFVGIVGVVAGWLTNLALPLGAVFIVLAAVKFVTSRGNEQKVGEAKKALTYAVIGVFLMILGVGLMCIILNILGLPPGTTGC